MERTLVLIKPDGVQRKLVGTIIARFEARGLQLLAMKMVQVSQELAETHYKEHLGKSFYAGLVQYITAAPVVAMVWTGEHAIEAVRQTVGKTNPLEAAPGTIRHDFRRQSGDHLIPLDVKRVGGILKTALCQCLKTLRPVKPFLSI